MKMQWADNQVWFRAAAAPICNGTCKEQLSQHAICSWVRGELMDCCDYCNCKRVSEHSLRTTMEFFKAVAKRQ